MIRDLMRVGTLALLLACVAPGTSHAKGIGWPEAVDRLSGERSRAENCLELLKGYGNKKQVARLRSVYSEAKADFNAVIDGLVTALAEGGTPESLPKLEIELERGKSHLKEFCDSAHDLVPKGFVGEAEIQQAIGYVSEAVAAIYNNYRTDAAVTRQAIKTQLEAAKWPEFGEVD